MSDTTLARVPFADGERYEMMWGCCGGTHVGSWQNNGNDYYAGEGTVCVAPIAGTVVRAGPPPLGQGERVGIQGDGKAVYMAHMQNLRVVVGDRVTVGHPSSRYGRSPRMPDHLHSLPRWRRATTAAGASSTRGIRSRPSDPHRRPPLRGRRRRPDKPPVR